MIHQRLERRSSPRITRHSKPQHLWMTMWCPRNATPRSSRAAGGTAGYRSLPPAGKAGRAAPVIQQLLYQEDERTWMPADPRRSAWGCPVHGHNGQEATSCPSAGERTPAMVATHSAVPQTPTSQKLWEQIAFLFL